VSHHARRGVLIKSKIKFRVFSIEGEAQIVIVRWRIMCQIEVKPALENWWKQAIALTIWIGIFSFRINFRENLFLCKVF
jgi:hypothetical protein